MNQAATSTPAWQLKASENGTKPAEYAHKLNMSCSADATDLHRRGFIEQSMVNQGWSDADARKYAKDEVAKHEPPRIRKNKAEH